MRSGRRARGVPTAGLLIEPRWARSGSARAVAALGARAFEARAGRAGRAPLSCAHARAAVLALALLAAQVASACTTTRGPRVEPPPLAAEAALAEAQEWLRSGQAGARRNALQAASRAAAAAPEWIAPQRVLDDLRREDLLGLEALRERLARARQDPNDAAAAYLVGRLEGEEGRAHFERAVEADPDLSWGYHGLAWLERREGRPRRAAQLERRALARSSGSFERSLFTSSLADHLAAAGQALEAVRALEQRLAADGVLAVDRASLSTQLALAEMSLVLDEELRERGYLRALALVSGDGPTPGETRSLVDRMLLHRSPRSREELLLEIELALARSPSEANHLLRAELLVLEGPSPLSLELLQQSLESDSAIRTDAAAARIARFDAGQFARGVDVWLASQPALVLDPAGMPRDARLVRCVSAARAAVDGTADAERLVELCEATLAAGWFREARAVAARLASKDLARALEYETRAAAGRAIVRAFARVARTADGRAPVRPGADPVRGLDELLDELSIAWARFADQLGGEATGVALSRSPRLVFGPFGSVLHPGPAFSATDEAAGLGRAGEKVPGLARALDLLGLFGIFGRVAGDAPDGTLLQRVHVEHRSGEHLGAPWQGTVALCESVELETRAGRNGARIAGAALHEGYWIDLDAPREELASWEALARSFFGPTAAPERAVRALEVEALPIDYDGTDRGLRRLARVRLLSPLGEADRVRLALLRDRLRAGVDPPSPTLDELTRVLMVHEEGHLCDRARFLPLGRNALRAVRLLFRSGVSPRGLLRRLEYRAQLVALCEVGDPRIPLAEILEAAEVAGRGVTPHAEAYEELLADLLKSLDAGVEHHPEVWPQIDPRAYLVHQLHRLGPEQIRELALAVARREEVLGG